MKWILLVIQVVLSIFLVVFTYKQINQDYLDTLFIVYVIFYILFVFRLYNGKVL
ncbi:Uncharacterised protein [Staphylococcus xylosus]|nr:Uncharacterised protein [Staphylococcus xylosus]